MVHHLARLLGLLLFVGFLGYLYTSPAAVHSTTHSSPLAVFDGSNTTNVTVNVLRVAPYLATPTALPRKSEPHPERPLQLPLQRCSDLCLINSELQSGGIDHGNSLMCVTFSNGAALRNHRDESACLWGYEMDPHRRWRADVMVSRLFSAVAPRLQVHGKFYNGVVLVETHDDVHCNKEFVAAMRRVRVPVLAMDAQVDRTDVVLVPDAYFLNGGGYVGVHAELDNIATTLPWHKKLALVRWRGSSTGVPDLTNTRIRVARAAHSSKNPGTLDAALVNNVQLDSHVSNIVFQEHLIHNQYSRKEMVEARGILDIQGNAAAWESFLWKLYSNSLVLKIESVHRQWYYPRVKPWVHYVPVKNDLSDLWEKIAFALDPKNDEKILEIITAATELARSVTIDDAIVQLSAQLIEIFGNPEFASDDAGGPDRPNLLRAQIKAPSTHLLRGLHS